MSITALRDLYDRKVRTLLRRPALGAMSVRSSARLLDELACEVRRGNTTVLTDLDAHDGGENAVATPGDLMRAALGASLAMGYRIWSAQLGVDVQSVELDVTCECDARGELGVADDVPVGWQRLSLEVRITSDAPYADVERVVERANRLNPLLANLSPAIARVHTLTVHSPHDPLSSP